MQKTKAIPLWITFFIVVIEIAISFNSILLPNIKTAFVISERLAQITIAVGLFTLGLSGLVYGAIADFIGRRPMFLFSISLFTLTAYICAQAQSIEIFLFARFLQGIGSGAGWVVGNACLKDLFHGRQYIKVMNLIHAVAGIIPAIAPIVGSYIAVVLGWRVGFYMLSILGLLVLVGMFYGCPETLDLSKRQLKNELNYKKIFSNYFSLFKQYQFLRYCGVKVIAVMLIFCEISTIPLVFIDYLFVDPKFFGFYIFPVVLCYVFATVLNNYLSRYIVIDRLILIGLGLLASSNIILLILSWGFKINLSPVEIQAIKAFSYMGWGFVFGNATAMIVSQDPAKAGMASALMISAEMLFAALGIYILGIFFNGSLVPLSIYIIIFTIFAFFWFSILNKLKF